MHYLVVIRINAVEGTLAIENVWIIDSNSGICIYDWCSENKEKTIDEQLVSGLLVAFKNFSSEAGLVDISAIEGIDRKLAYQSKGKYIIASICHRKDYEPLVEEMLQKILKSFIKKYKELLEHSTDVSPYRTFDEDLTKTLEGTIAARNVLSTIIGAIAAIAIVAVLFLIGFTTLSRVQAAVGYEIASLILFLEILAGVFIGGIISGVIAGERRIAMISSSLTALPVIGTLIGLQISSWDGVIEKIFYSLLYIMIFLAISILGGIIGGYIKERRFLFPELDFEPVAPRQQPEDSDFE